MRLIKFPIVIFILFHFISGTSHGQWARTNGPNGGYVADFTVNGNSIFAGTIDGIFKSEDTGLSWIRVSDLSPFTITVNVSTIFAGGSEILVRSTDNGNTWIDISGNLPVNHITSQLYVHNGILFVGTSGAGVYRSTNNGNSFEAVNNGFGAFAFISSFASSGNLLFTGLTGSGGTVGVYVSSNEGNSWTQVVNGLPINGMSTQALTVNGTDVFAAVNDQGFYKSTNNGGSWFPVNTGFPLIVSGGVNVLETRGGIIYAGRGGDGAWKSTNGGEGWTHILSALPAQTSPLGFFISDTYVLLGSQHAVYRSSNNGSSWVASYKGIANTLVTDLIAYENNIYASTSPSNSGYGEGVSLTPDNGDTWNDANGGFPKNISVNALTFNGTTMFAGAINGIYKSTNLGSSWSKDSSDVGAGVQKIIVKNNTIFAATYGKGILKSTDNGITWQYSNNGLGNGVTVLDLMVDGNNLYAGIFWGVYVSTDNGANWVNKSAGIYPGSTVYSLAKSGNNLLAGTYSGLYLSSNNGTSWNETPSGPFNSSIHDFAVSGNNVYAAADSGVYKSSNNGLNWSAISTGLPAYTEVVSILIKDDNIFIGTEGKGVWKQPLPGIFTLNVKLFIEGFYNSVTNKMVSDSIRVYLRNSTSPYAIVDSARALLDSNGNGSFGFLQAVNSVPYYMVTKHRNGLETWSSLTYSFTSGQLSYDFTTAASQAFGNNMKQIDTSPVRFGMYSGDVTGDGSVNLSDIIPIYNNASGFVNGYAVTDLTGDNVTNLTDILIAFNNSTGFVSIRRP